MVRASILLAVTVIAVAGVTFAGCQSCSDCYDYSSPLAGPAGDSYGPPAPFVSEQPYYEGEVITEGPMYSEGQPPATGQSYSGGQTFTGPPTQSAPPAGSGTR